MQNKEKKRGFCRTALRLAGTTAKVGALAFAGTFTIYMLNLENKLIYRVVRPVLNRHYDNQQRDRRI